jgi:hypothetical protein
MTLDQLRAALARTLRLAGLPAYPDLVDELVSIADHHAAEESAAAAGAG